MKADELLVWEKIDLANMLAERLADAEDLLEAMPELQRVTEFEAGRLYDYIDRNLQVFLADFDPEELCQWVEEKELEEEIDNFWEEYHNECLEEDYAFTEYMMNEYYLSVIEEAMFFSSPDLAEQRGFTSRLKKS